MEGDLNVCGEHTEQYTDDILQNCASENYMILTNVTPMNSISFLQRYLRQQREQFWKIMLQEYQAIYNI